MSQNGAPIQGPPYPPTTAGVGGVPTIGLDIPISASFIFLYICFAVTNMTLFQRNRRRGRKFVPSALLFGFCMARIATLVLRIAWANRKTNIRLAIAAQVFVNAGVLLIYIINFLLAQRILRAKQPQVGWNPVLRIVSRGLYVSIVGALVMVITSLVLTLYTLNPHTRSRCRDVQLAAITFLVTFTTLPLVQLLLAYLLPRSRNEERFGEGSMTSKVIIVTTSTCLCMFIAGFKAGTAWSPPRPATNPAWFDSKASFYVFSFVLEILALTILTISRIDKRFIVPNGCKGPGDYTRLGQSKTEEIRPPSAQVEAHSVDLEKENSVDMEKKSSRAPSPQETGEDLGRKSDELSFHSARGS